MAVAPPTVESHAPLPRQPHWQTVTATGLTCAVLALGALHMRISGQISLVGAAQLVAAQELRLNLATAHLWLEEAVAGDATVDFERDAGRLVDAATAEAEALAHGGLGRLGVVAALEDEQRVRRVVELADRLRAWRGFAAQRLLSRGVAGSKDDQSIDASFGEIEANAAALVESLEEARATSASRLEWLQWVTVVAVALLCGCLWLVLRRGRRRLLARASLLAGAVKEKTAELQTRVVELERRNREIGLMSDMSDVMQTCGDGEEALRYLTPYLQALFPSQPGAVFVFRNSRNLLEPIARWGEVRVAPESFEPDGCWALRRGRVHAANRP